MPQCGSVASPKFTIYCDKPEDVAFAQTVFTDGPLASAELKLLVRGADPCLAEYLSWERADWIIVRDGAIVAIAEITEHGYTGDNGFQRFARPMRAAMLGVPFVYFSPFSRTRLNEMEDGSFNARNVAPEMFGALLQAGERYDVPCLAVRWPTDDHGQPVVLTRRHPSVVQLKSLMDEFATRRIDDTGWSFVPPGVLDEMRVQAAIPYRVGETRLLATMPVDVEDSAWIWDLVPDDYYRSGKAEKVFAHAALDSTARRRLPQGAPGNGFWTRRGRAQVLYLGYQWRPDPATGLIAFSGALAERAGLPLVVVWPRVFMEDGPARQQLLKGWDELRVGRGSLLAHGQRLGIGSERLIGLGARANAGTREKQFGVFTPNSKVGRVMAEVADLVVFGDALYLPR